MRQQCENWNSIPIKQQISALKPQEIHHSMLVVMVYLLSSFQEKTNKLKNIPQPSVRKSNPDIVQSAKTIPSPKILLLTWSSFPDGLPQKRNGEASPPSPAPPEPPTCSGCPCVSWCSPWVCPACGSMFGISCLSFLLVFPCAWWLPKSYWFIWKSKRWSGKELDSLRLNKCLNSNISLQILRRGGGNCPHKVKNTEYWIGILHPSASSGVVQEQGVMIRCCSRP